MHWPPWSRSRSTPREVGEQARRLADRLVEVLEREKAVEPLRGLRLVRSALDDPDDERGLKEAARLFAEISRGRAPFSEFYVARDDFEERRRLNDEFSSVRQQLGALLDG